MDHSIKPLTPQHVIERAHSAVQQHIPLHEANTYDGHIGAAFAAAYNVHAESLKA